MEKFIEMTKTFMDDKYAKALVILVASLIVAWIIRFLYKIVFRNIVKKTKTKLDDEIVEAFSKPVFYTIVLAGLIWSIRILGLPQGVNFFSSGILKTIIAVLWISSFLRTVSIILNWLGKRKSKYKLIQKKTIPLFENTLKLIIIGGGTYFILLIWKINVTAWLASAGIAGLAIGFAAKDTLANFFSGIFIMVDSPYKIGDYIVLDSGERGRVTMIGLRSTRVLTLEDIEITIPNAVIGNAKITNESGGPYEKHRVKVAIGVAYGSDIDKVRKILYKIADKNENVCKDPPPKVRFRAFGDSSLDFQLLCWIEKPGRRGLVIDELNTSIYKEFNKQKVEIPFPQRDIHIKK
ncbi:MAG: mechanosensitive ion channel family protein [Candidatus Aminicenantes bacterium]|nr:mechanosensitive ion channel family protein [Candidatus Aminicenantes bacterium]